MVLLRPVVKLASSAYELTVFPVVPLLMMFGCPKGMCPPVWKPLLHFYWFSLVNGKIPTRNYRAARAFFFHLSYRIFSVSAVGSIQPRWNNAEGRWTAVYFLIYYIRLHLTIEAECTAEERNNGELMDQGGRFSARLEVEDCRGRFRYRGRESECCVLGGGDLQVNWVYKTVDRRDWWRTSISVLREVSGIPSCLLSVNGSFSRLYFPDSSQFAVESCPAISPLTLLMLYTSASSQARPRDPDLILKSTSCPGWRLLLRTPFDTVIVGAMVF